MRNALSVDLEDWYHPELVRKHIHGNSKYQIVQSTERILDLFDKYNVKATFFILGDVARKHPDLIRKINSKGHEIASHGISHKPLWELNYTDFNWELKDFNKLVNKILGKKTKIYGFRAPTFSIDNETKYAIKCLVDNNYYYDSSIFPVKNYMYGVNGAPLNIYRPDINNLTKEDNNSKIIEFPLTVFKLGWFKIPVSGGFYLRVIPYFILKIFLKLINRKRPFVIYFHPWETYKLTPRIRKIGAFNYFITYYGINNSIKKIECLLRDFKFLPIINLVNEIENNSKIKDYFEKCADRFDGFYKERKMNIIQYFAHKFLRKPGLVRRFKTTVDILSNIKNKTILDVGCGSGIYSIYFTKKGANVTGIDFSSKMISLARFNASKENCKINFISNNFINYKFKNNFDYLLAIGVFDYVKVNDLKKYFEKFLKITNNKIIATFPKKFVLQAPIRYLWLKKQNCPVYFYTKKQIKKIAKDFSIKVIFHDCGPIWTVEFIK